MDAFKSRTTSQENKWRDTITVPPTYMSAICIAGTTVFGTNQ